MAKLGASAGGSEGPTAPDSVRPARLPDTARIGHIQATVWRAAHAELFGPEVLRQLTPELLAEQWTQAVELPPSPEHRILVAVDASEVRGFAAVSPCQDPDRPEHTGELLALLIDPEATGRGHASRLLTAVVDLARQDGQTALVAWVSAAEKALEEFLASTGWAPDGATRTLDMFGDGQRVAHQVRLHTDLGGA